MCGCVVFALMDLLRSALLALDDAELERRARSGWEESFGEELVDMQPGE